jgi:hypothetical protein
MFQCLEHLQNNINTELRYCMETAAPTPEGSEKGIRKRLFAFFKSNNLFSPENCKQILEDLTEQTKPCRKYAERNLDSNVLLS